MEGLILYVHIGFLCIAGIGILLADSSALAWLRGKRETVDAKALFVAHWVVTIGLSGLILTGLYLFWPMRSYLLGQPLFWLKMGFVVALVINSFVIEALMNVAQVRPFNALTTAQKFPLMLSGAVSVICWAGAFLVAITLF
ncbi:MAG TPA: hypothetical protein VMU13_03635 [Candidatus Paceibacterota bacterium]|nr:hypothetical protein [Candidatus Paceibacterota bacterium]